MDTSKVIKELRESVNMNSGQDIGGLGSRTAYTVGVHTTAYSISAEI